MFPLVFLFICLVVLLIVIWAVLYKDVLSPAILLHLSFIGAILLLIKGAERLEIKSFSYETAFLLLMGIVSFTLGGIMCSLIQNDRRRPYSGLKNPQPLIVNDYLYVAFVSFATIVAYVQFKHEVAYVGFAGTFTEIVSKFRDDAVMEGVEPNPFVALGSRMIFALQPLLIFLTLYNKIVCKQNFGKLIVLIPCILVYIVCIFIIAGSRGKIFTILFQILFALSICYNLAGFGKGITTDGKTLAGNKIWFKVALLVFFIGIPTFYYVGVVQGKRYSEMSLFEPVENYFSYGLIHLNHTVETGVYEVKDFGGWSFPGLYSALNKFGADYPFYDSVPFYSRYGNTLTLFGRWYQDFNIIGVAIMSLFVGYFFSFVYYKMIYAKDKESIIRNSTFYIFFMPTILMASYDDWVKSLLAINGFFQIFFLYIVILIIKNSIKENSCKVMSNYKKIKISNTDFESLKEGMIVKVVRSSRNI